MSRDYFNKDQLISAFNSLNAFNIFEYCFVISEHALLGARKRTIHLKKI